MSVRVAIVGAGVSGSFLAHLLRETAAVTVYEKSRGVGGRCSYRRHPEHGAFRHGAQFMTFRDEELHPYIQPLVDQDILCPYPGEIAYFESIKTPWKPAHPQRRYIAQPTMNHFLKPWLQQADLKVQSKVTDIQLVNGCARVVAEGQKAEDYDLCVLTAPLPQCHDLVATLPYPPLQSVGCYAVMLTTQKTSPRPWQAAFVKGSPLSWVACQSEREDAENWVLHSAPHASQEGCDHAEVIDKMSAELEVLLGEALQPKSADVHFWRYAMLQAESEHAHTDFIWDPERPFAACGDWYCGGRVEGAMRSAYQLSKRLIGAF